METETTSFWYKFFTEAGIPASDASSHAVAFTKHRIKMEMLTDLNKEYLNDMGVTMMGDVIAILKHAKTISQQSSREQALMGIAGSRSQTPPRRSTPASRTVAHYLGKDEKAGPMNEPMIPTPKISQDLAARLGPVNEPLSKRSTSPLVLRQTIATRSASPLALRQTVKKTTPTSPIVVRINTQKQKEVVPVPKSRRVLPEHEGKYKIKMPQGTTARTKKILERAKATAAGSRKCSSVFDRLGKGDSPGMSRKFKVTGLDKIVIHKSAADSPESSVFQRLGGKVIKRAATSTVPDSSDTDHDSDEPGGKQLEYQGVFKDSPPKKKIKIQRKAIVLKDQPEKTDVLTKPSTEGIFSPFSQHSKKPVTARLGNFNTKGAAVIAEAQTTTSTNPKIQLKKTSVEGRLGPPIAEKSTGSKGVFSRLGKQH